MDDFVPEFHGIEDMYEIPTSSSGFSRHKKHAHGEEDIMELMWQNGQVVAQKTSKKSPLQREEAVVKEICSIEQEQQQHLFMQEDEMASWLHYPLDEDDSSSFDHRDLCGLFSAPPPPAPPVPLPVPTNPPPDPPRPQKNFGHFSRIPGRPMITTVVGSCPAVRAESDTAEVSGELDRKRKGTEAADDKESQCQSQSEDIDFEAGEPKKQARGSGSASTKRSRASQVHNLSERRRRDRINEKMKALQELIPRCNKVDKASMLDEAIEYLKSLQMQVQMMSMGCGMIPMMYPGMHQYMPAMGMGMGMGMDMGMNRPMVTYPSMVPGSSIPNPAAAPMGHTFPMQAFQLPPMHAPDSSQTQASNQTYPTLNPFVVHNPNQPRFPNFVNPYQQFHGNQQAQVPLPQNQAVMLQPSASAPSTSKETVNPETRQTG